MQGRRLSKREVEKALAAGVVRVQPVISVESIIGLDRHLRDGRRLLVSTEGGELEFSWGIGEQVADKQ
jgi:hypothetical protein